MKKINTAATILLAGMFLVHFAAELIFSRAQGQASEIFMARTRLSMKLFPLEPRFFREAGFQLLQDEGDALNASAIRKSIACFEAALKKNPLDYQSRYYLAKAYLRLSAISMEAFDTAITELTRVARLRGRNMQIAVDCSRVFFSVWPFLEKQDREFASSLLADAMPTISWADFSPLLEMWSLYVQDTPLLMELLKIRPGFFGPTANQLVAASIPLPKRHELLNLFEIHTLDDVERRYNEMIINGAIGLNDAQSLLNRIRVIRGYYRLFPESAFDREKFFKIRRILVLAVIDGMLDREGVQEDPKSLRQINGLILEYIRDNATLNDLGTLLKTLGERNYFRSNDFASLKLKTLIDFRMGNYDDIITEIESLRKGISYVKKEQVADYTDILLLLVDAYYSTKLMTAAEGVAHELYRGQPDNPNVLFRILRIHKILGDAGVPDPALAGKLAIIEKSRFLTIGKLNRAFEIFLFSQPEIEIVLEPSLRPSIAPWKLIQVFMDDWIVFECYADSLPEKIIIAPPFTSVESKVKIQVLGN